eukprot:GEMP01111988.1.p1 GENE.GEMP01111988.1~~GEMP01111988.1.p1  ORF type:complete len:184 (+),score=19.81 GEMP01111988.1:116-667(+)
MVDLSCIWHAHPRAHTDIHETSFSAGFMYTPTLTKLKELALCKSGDAYWNCRLSNFGDRIRYCDKWCGKLGGLSWNKQRMTSCRFYDVDDYLETKALGSLYATHRPYRLHNKAICCSVPPNPLSMLAAVTSKTVKAALQKDLFGSMVGGKRPIRPKQRSSNTEENDIVSIQIKLHVILIPFFF